MKKGSPNKIVLEFIDSTKSSLGDWRTINDALSSEPIQLRRRVAADAFLALAVSWEVFLSEWLIAAVNKNASQAVASLSDDLQKYAMQELRIPDTHLVVKHLTQSHFNLESVRRLLDPNDNNVIIRDHKGLKSFAEKWLSGAYREVVDGISYYQFKPILATRLVRNVLAHQSDAAITRACDELRKNNTPPELRTGRGSLSVDGWRRYLLAGNKRPRIVAYHDELAEAAQLFTVPSPGQ